MNYTRNLLWWCFLPWVIEDLLRIMLFQILHFLWYLGLTFQVHPNSISCWELGRINRRHLVPKEQISVSRKSLSIFISWAKFCFHLAISSSTEHYLQRWTSRGKFLKLCVCINSFFLLNFVRRTKFKRKKELMHTQFLFSSVTWSFGMH